MICIHLIIYATHSEGNFDILIQKASELGYDISIVGWGNKWEGFYKRTLDLYEFFKTRPSNEIIMCIDGFDSMILENTQTTLATFASFESPIVWGIEESNSLLRRYLFRSKYNYTLNGGSFIGVNKYLQLIFNEIVHKYGINNYKQDDQRIVNQMNNKSPLFQSLVQPDLESKIFANLIYNNFVNTILRNNNALTHNYNENGIYHKKTGTYPCVISGPGNVKLDEILKTMGYNQVQTRPNYYKFFIDNFIMDLTCVFVILFLFCIVTVFLIKYFKR